MLDYLEQLTNIAAGVLGVCTVLAGYLALDRRKAGPRKSVEEVMKGASVAGSARAEILKSFARERLVARVLLILCLMLFGASLYLLQSHGAQVVIAAEARALTSRQRLGQDDPNTFAPAGNENFEIARAYPTRSSVETESPLAAVLDSAERSFDFYALTGTVLSNVGDNLKGALKRGVNVRLMLTDFGVENAASVDAFLDAMGVLDSMAHSGRAKQTERLVRELEALVARDRTTYKGGLDVRWISIPFHNSLWVVDAAGDSPYAHVAITHYNAENGGPCVRFGALARGSVERVSTEFDVLWRRAKSAPSAYR